MASTYTPIATTTLGSATNSYTFSSIPSTYTDLIMVWNGTTAAQDNLSLRFNGDTATNYSVTRLVGNGSTAASARFSSVNMMYGSIPDTSANSTVTWQVMNYSNATTYKTALCRGSSASVEASAYVGLWRSTSAITSLTVIVGNSYNMNTGCTLTLYGILSA